jgi:hypothetical protein
MTGVEADVGSFLASKGKRLRWISHVYFLIRKKVTTSVHSNGICNLTPCWGLVCYMYLSCERVTFLQLFLIFFQGGRLYVDHQSDEFDFCLRRQF